MTDLPDGIDYKLTLRWPFATAIVDGPKRVANQSVRPGSTCGERVAIRCGEIKDEQAADNITRNLFSWYPKYGRSFDEIAGCIVGTARVVGWIDEDPGCGDILEVPSYLEGELPGEWSEQSEVLTAMHRDEWFVGPVAWILDDVEALEKPVPARGGRGCGSSRSK